MDGTLVKAEELPLSPDERELFLRITRALGCTPERWVGIMKCADRMQYYDDCYGKLKEKCQTLEGICEVLHMMQRRSCCTANINFSSVTIDEYSDDSQVNIDQIITGLGGDYLNAFPLTPGKKIRLQQKERPGWGPSDIRIDLNLSGGQVNYLDYTIQFFLGPGDQVPGKPIGPLYTGNQFLNKDGTQIKLPFPTYKNEPIIVGSLEKLTVELTNKGIAGNLDSAQIIVPFNNEAFYEMCKTACTPLSHRPKC
jgi:hypothetical protein